MPIFGAIVDYTSKRWELGRGMAIILFCTNLLSAHVHCLRLLLWLLTGAGLIQFHDCQTVDADTDGSPGTPLS